MQYYTTRRYIGTNGKTAGEMAKFYEPELAQKIEDFNLTAAKSNDTPVFRQMTDDLLMKLLESGRIPLEIFLNNCSLPGADKLLAEVRQTRCWACWNPSAVPCLPAPCGKRTGTFPSTTSSS